MIGRQAVAAILDQYEKHGWKLRRVLLSTGLRDSYAEIAATLFQGVELCEADIDALWFSRSSKPGLTAWELRHLSSSPYALVETVRDDMSDQEVEELLGRTEMRLRETLTRRKENGSGAA